jgi:hypothetical protein
VGFVVEKETLEQIFSEYFGFRCQAFYRLPHTQHNSSSSSSSGADIIGHLVALVIVDLVPLWPKKHRKNVGSEVLTSLTMKISLLGCNNLQFEELKSLFSHHLLFLVSCLAYSSAFSMEARCYFKTLGSLQLHVLQPRRQYYSQYTGNHTSEYWERI